jgi:hypothetical protein
MGVEDYVKEVVSLLKQDNNDTDLMNAINAIYENTGSDWYKTYPYVFSIEDQSESGTQNYFYALPIPPESLTIQMVAPNDAVATLGGVMEEPSPVVFWNIQMAGTTGVGVGRSPDNFRGGDAVGKPASLFRDVIPKTGLATSLMMSAARVSGYAAGALSIGASALFDPAGAASKTLEYTIQPHLPYSYSAVPEESNGFTEIHRLHKFFIFYTNLNSRRNNPEVTKVNVDKFKKKQFALYFNNYKDNQKFRIVLKNFAMTKAVGQPFLYKYQIQLKGWNLEPADESLTGQEVDRFKGDLASVSTVTLTSAVTKAKNLMRAFNSAKTDPLGTFLSIPPVV